MLYASFSLHHFSITIIFAVLRIDALISRIGKVSIKLTQKIGVSPVLIEWILDLASYSQSVLSSLAN